jgi:hypothetical protein
MFNKEHFKFCVDSVFRYIYIVLCVLRKLSNVFVKMSKMSYVWRNYFNQPKLFRL